MKRLETLSNVILRLHLMMRKETSYGLKFKVVDKLKEDQGINAMVIFSFASFGIIKRMYENLTDKNIIIDCGKELNEFNAMCIIKTILAFAMDELNANRSITNQVRIIEHWLDGIGKWKA